MDHGIKIKVSPILPPGTMAMQRKGVIVWCGPVGSPIGDAEFDMLHMHPADVDRLKVGMDKHNSRADIIRALLNSST